MGMSAEALKRLEERLASIEGGLQAAVTDDPYLQARQEFSFVTAPQPGGYITSSTGKLLYDNGVIADPTTGSILFPSSAAVAGSAQWTSQVQDEWSQEKVSEWRKKLAAQGYEVAESGGWAVDLVNGLTSYHTNRYLNFGKPIAMTPGGSGATGTAVRKSFDKEMVKETIKSWGDVIWDEPLDDDVADWWADRQIELAVELAKKNPDWSFEQVQGGAELRAQKEFTESPGIKGALREAEQLEGSTKLRDSMISLSQVTGI